MDFYLVVKTLHIISSTVLFGTGLGIAFFMLRSHYTDSLPEKFYAVSTTVLADYVFTLPAVIIQPLSGICLIWQAHYDWKEMWLVLTYAIYLIAGACWVPVVLIQIRLKNILAEAGKTNAPLPEEYRRLFRIWFLLGWPAFLGLVAVFYLMVAKPAWP